MNINGEGGTSKPSGKKGSTETTHFRVTNEQLKKVNTSEGSEMSGVKKTS